MRATRVPVVRMVPQRYTADCGSAVLAMFLGVSYEDVVIALGAHAMRQGVWLADLERGALVFGVRLTRKRRWDHETADGIAQVRYTTGPNHVVLIRAGLAFDTDFSVWEPDDLLKAKRGTYGPLLVRAE